MIKINNFRLVIMLIIFSAPPFFINIFAQETGNETFNKGVKSVDVGGKSSGFSSEEYWQHISGGNSYITKGDYHLAIKQYQQALQIDLSNATAYVGLGSAYLALKEYQKALVNYEKSIQIDPENATIY